MPKAGGSLKALQAGMPLAKTENLQRRRAMQKSGVLHFDPGLPLFREHFPGAPRVPGSLIIAALAEEAGLLFPHLLPVRAGRFRFRLFLTPGDWPFSMEYDETGSRVLCRVGSDRIMADGVLVMKRKDS